MYRNDRAEKTKRCIEIVESNDIRTQGEFADKYQEKYGEKVSQTTVHRMFEFSNIIINSETGFYVHVNKFNPAESDFVRENNLINVLESHSCGKYSHEKGVKIISIAVDIDAEKMVARAIYDFCKGEVTILYGYNCLYIRCTTVEMYKKLTVILREHYYRDV